MTHAPRLILIALLIVTPAQAGPATDKAAAKSAPMAATGPATRPSYADPAAEAIAAVLDSEEFKRTQTVSGFRFKDDGSDEPPPSETPAWLQGLFDIVGHIGSVSAGFGELLLWLLALTVVALLVIYRRHWVGYIGGLRGRVSKPPAAAQTHSALTAAAPLPADIGATALRLWQAGDKAQALSLLYRGALEGLERRYRVVLVAGATEAEILRATTGEAPPLREYLAGLLAAWQALAYAHRPPAQIDHLVEGYRRHFDESSA